MWATLAGLKLTKEGVVDLVAVVVAGLLFAGGFYFGGLGPSAKLAKVEAELAVYKAKVDAAATVQTERNQTTAAQGAAITQSVGGEYEKARKNLVTTRAAGTGRVLHADRRCRQAAPVPRAAGSPDAAPVDAAPDPGEPAADAGTLEADAAATALQLIYLQDWVEQQREAWQATQGSSPEPVE